MIYNFFCKILTLVVLFFGINQNYQVFANDLPDYAPSTYQGIVLKIENEEHNDTLEELFQSEQIIQNLKIKILTGKLKNEQIKLQNFITNNPCFDIKLKQGDRILVDIDNITHDINLSAKDNSRILLSLFIVFSILLVSFYKKFSLKFLSTITIAGILIFFALIPLIFFTYNPILWTLIIGIFLSSLIIFLINGQKGQSVCSAISTSIGLLLITFLITLINHSSGILGIDTQENIILLGEFPKLNFTEIITSSAILSSIGALIYLSTTISNYIFMYFTPQDNYKEIFSSVLNFSKIPITNLFLVIITTIIGMLFPILLLSYQTNFLKFINFNRIFTELSTLLSILIILLITIPITCLNCTIFMKRDILLKNFKNKGEKND